MPYLVCKPVGCVSGAAAFQATSFWGAGLQRAAAPAATAADASVRSVTCRGAAARNGGGGNGGEAVTVMSGLSRQELFKVTYHTMNMDVVDDWRY